MTIWKYTLEITDEQTLRFPKTHQILSVGEQDGQLRVWVMVHPGIEGTDRTFRVLWTGNPIPKDIYTYPKYGFVGTVQAANGLVWHIFVK